MARNEFLTGLQIGGALVGPFADAMRQWRTDQIANELLNQMDPPRAAAVKPTAETRAADALYGGASKPRRGGAAELKLHVAMADAAAKRRAAGLREEIQQEQLTKLRKPPGPRIFHEQQGGVTLVDPASGAARYVRPEGLPARSEKPSFDPIELKKWQGQLAEFHRRRNELQGDAQKLSTPLAAFGVPVDALSQAQNFRRVGADGAGDDEGEYFTADTPAGAISGKWADWEKLAPSRNSLKALMDELRGMQEPQAPEPLNSSAGAADLVTIRSPAEAAKLPRGTRFRDPHGVVRMVP